MRGVLKQLLTYAIIVAFSLCCHANAKVDSLLSGLGKATDKETPVIYNSVGRIYLLERDSVQAFEYFRKAFAYASENKDNDGVVNALSNIGNCYYEFDNFIVALDFYKKALEKAQTIPNYNLSDIYNNIGLSYFRLNEHDASLETFLEGVRKTEVDSDDMASLYSNIGNVYSTINNNTTAIRYLKDAVEINKRLNNELKLATNYNEIGVYYYEMSMLDSAKVYFNLALRMFRKINHEERVAIVVHNLANIHIETKDSINLALSYLDEALETFQKINKTSHIIYLMESKGAAYTVAGDYNQALKTYQDGLKIAHNELNPDYYVLMKYYNDLRMLYEKMGRTENAYQSYKLYSAYKDSILEENQIARINELERRFNFEKKEEEIKLLNTEKEMASLQVQQLKLIRLSGVIVIVLLSVLIIFILIEYRAKKRTNRILEEKNVQINKVNVSQTKFLSILAHDLRNPFHSVLGYSLMLNKEYDKFSDEKRKQFSGEIYKFSGNIYQLLQNLLDWSRTLIGLTNFNPNNFELRRVCDAVMNMMRSTANLKNITIDDQVPEKLEVHADFLMVQSILNNLIGNAIKFSNVGSKIELTANYDDSTRRVVVKVKDEGIGLTQEKIDYIQGTNVIPEEGSRGESGSGLGLIICREYAAFHKGELKIESEPEKGSIFSFTLPPSLP